MEISFYFKETKKGFTTYSNFTELSIYKGLRAWGKTKELAVLRLICKWNKKVAKDHKRLLKNKPDNVSILKCEYTLQPTTKMNKL